MLRNYHCWLKDHSQISKMFYNKIRECIFKRTHGTMIIYERRKKSNAKYFYILSLNNNKNNCKAYY